MSEQRTLFDEGKTIDERFREFVAKNPHVVAEFLRRARLAVDEGATRLSSRDIFSDMRRDPNLKVDDKPFKLSDHYSALMSRLAENRDPTLEGLFELRKRPSQVGG